MSKALEVYGGKILLESVLEYCPEFITVKDLNCNYLACTKSYSKFCNLNAEEIIGKNVFDVIPENIASQVENYVNEVVKTKMLKTYSLNLDLQDEVRSIKQILVPIIKEDSISSILTISVDITEDEKRLEQLDLYISTLVHDLKNPIISLSNTLELLKKGGFGEINNEQNEILEAVLESIFYMKTLVSSILKTHKINQGILQLERSNFDINDLILSCINELKFLCDSKNISINYICKNVLTNFYGDKLIIKRVLTNLLDNAIKYSFENSTIEIEFKIENNEIIFIIENSGHELDQNLKQNIFEKYSCGKRIESIGLGLYFVKHAIKAHNGNITFDSKGIHHKFTINLPILNAENKFVDKIYL